MAKTVVGIFRSIDDAQAVVRELQSSGFKREDISLTTRDKREGREAKRETGVEDVKEGALGGAGLGALLGGGAGLLAGLGALTIPGIGPIVAAGPIAATLGGAGVGAVAGGIAGALIDMGIPEEDAEQYAQGVHRGGTLVSVRTEDHRAQAAAGILERHNPMDVRRGAAAWAEMESWGQMDEPISEESTRVPIVEEHLRVGSVQDMGEGDIDFDRFEPEFRQHYNTSFSQTGRRFRDYRPAYQYGYKLRRALNCNGACDWDEVWPEAQRDWERTHPGLPWHEAESAIRQGFEQRYH